MTETMRALIVDDEPLAREGIRLHLEEEPGVQIVGEAGTGQEAVRALEELQPDVVFLDVQMPELNGFEVLEALQLERLPMVVFVTAYDEFALRAFETHALDYLLKPVDPERLSRAVDRVRERLRDREGRELDRRVFRLLEELRGGGRYLERLAIRNDGRILFLRVKDIDWIEAAGNYARIHAGKQEYLFRETMIGLEARLDPQDFMRIHRSTIVRVDRIRELEPLFQGDYVVILHDGTRLTSSRSYRDRLQELMEGAR